MRNYRTPPVAHLPYTELLKCSVNLSDRFVVAAAVKHLKSDFSPTHSHNSHHSPHAWVAEKLCPTPLDSTALPFFTLVSSETPRGVH